MKVAVDRSELERLDRDALIERAMGLGVSRARVLTRAELVDELIVLGPDDPQDKQRARGFFGVARDLLAHVVEQGLHLPDAAERLRSCGALPPSARTRAPSALPTVTLAEIYAAQGHISRAVDTIQSVLVREPDHEAARALLARLTDVSYPRVRSSSSPAAEGEHLGAGQHSSAGRTSDDDDAEDAAPHESSGGPAGRGPRELALDGSPGDVDECVAIPVDSRTMYVCWALRFETMLRLERRCSPGAAVLRLVAITPNLEGPIATLRDCAVTCFMGDAVVCDLPAGAVVRVAVGWKTASGDFYSAAHSPALEAAPGDRSTWGIEAIFRSTPGGLEPIGRDDTDAPAIIRALARARREPVDERSADADTDPPGVAAIERWVYAPKAWSIPLA